MEKFQKLKNNDKKWIEYAFGIECERIVFKRESLYNKSSCIAKTRIGRSIFEMTQIRQDAIKLLEQIPEDKIIFIIQIMQGIKGLYTDDDMKEREEAFLHLEKMRRKVPDLDYDKELAVYREEKYGAAYTN